MIHFDQQMWQQGRSVTSNPWPQEVLQFLLSRPGSTATREEAQVSLLETPGSADINHQTQE